MSEQSIFELFPWMNADFVKKVVENYERSENVSLKSFDAKSAFKSGENFSIHMITLAVNFTDKNKDLEKQKEFLMKIAIQTEGYAHVCNECHIYEREIEAYMKILPAIGKCFDSIGETFQIAPR